MSDIKLYRVTALISKQRHNEIVKLAKEKNLPMTRLASIAIYNEFQKDKPFDFDFSIPEEEAEEYAYADQATKILSYMRAKKNGLPIDIMIPLHHEMNIADKETFLFAFKELIDKDFLDIVTVDKDNKSNYPIGTVIYSIKKEIKTSKKLNKEAKEYEDYQKLKKKDI